MQHGSHRRRGQSKRHSRGRTVGILYCCAQLEPGMCCPTARFGNRYPDLSDVGLERAHGDSVHKYLSSMGERKREIETPVFY